MSMRVQGLGAVLAIVGALGIVLPLVAGWSAFCPWVSLPALAARTGPARSDKSAEYHSGVWKGGGRE